ncbi:MAG: PAS domain S-box protein [Gemmatimonadetes bacterium]|nr:PAS domain S-box protein [Gemmatimonadota bacterium]MBK7714119.1 PAS domain S-box protein [Gemmatimonadota bacterium]MBK7783180.1 PAS domain S-box protein [Gemmatimonadota bacterium]MBK7924122.1 PAS domain S-box protein [Gemmatimonadota bacterium]
MALVILSIFLQLLAAVQALLLARASSRPWAWRLLAGAIFLIGIGRVLLLRQIAAAPDHPSLVFEGLLALAVSVLVVIGLAALRPILGTASRARAAEAESRALENELSSLLEVVPAAVWFARDPDAAHITGNRAARELLRMPVGSNLSLSGPDAPRHFEVRQQGRALAPEELPLQRTARRGVELRGFEETIHFADGAERHLLGNVTPLRDEAGRARGAVAAFVDITDRRQAEQALEASERKYRTLVDLTATGYVIIDAAGRVLDANPEYVRLTGHQSLEEIRGHRVTEWTAPYDVDRNAAEVRQAVRVGSVTNLEVDYQHRDGAVLAIEINAAVQDDGTIVALCRDVSSRHQAADALRRSEERYALAASSARAGVWDWNVVSGETLFSPQWKALLGYDDAELPNHVRTWEEALHPDDRERVFAEVRRHFEQRTPYVVEYRMRARDGGWRWCMVHGQAVWDAAGRPVRMAGATIDITGQKESEHRIRELEERFFRYAEQSSEVFWLAQVEPERVLYVSPSFERIWGHSPAALYADPHLWLATIAADDRPAVERAWHGLVSRGEEGGYDLEYRITRADGRVRWIHDRATLVRDPLAGTAHLSGIAGDITDRKHAELLERAATRRVRAVIDASPLPIVTLDREGIVTGWNPAAERLYGFTAAEAVGGPSPVIPPEEREDFRRMVEAARREGGVRRLSATRRHKNGTTLEITISTAPLRDHTGEVTGLVAIHEDVTEQRRAGRATQQFQERLLEAQKLESIGVLAGGIAHDFNNLLTLVLGNAHLARAALPPEHPATEPLRQVEQASLRAAELTAQMLAYAGRGQFVVGPVDSSAVVRESASLLQAALPSPARLVLEPAEALPAIEADPSQLRQVLVNLVTNAGEALEGNRGIVTVRTGLLHATREFLVTTLLPQEAQPGPYVSLEVEDDGSGIDVEVQRRMFEPFFSTRFPGRGLGLAAVLGIVRRHRGTIAVASAPGRTVIRVLFPLAGRAPAVTVAAPAGAPRARLLLVDDEADVLRLMRTFLERAGYEVTTAANGEEALARFRELRERLGLVVLDLTMPGMGGDETLAAMAALAPEVPVMLTSGFSEEEVSRRCGTMPNAAFLPKPYLPAELVAEVGRWVRAVPPHPAGSPARGAR